MEDKISYNENKKFDSINLNRSWRLHEEVYGKLQGELIDIALDNPQAIVEVARKEGWAFEELDNNVQLDLLKPIGENEYARITIIPSLTNSAIQFRDHYELQEASMGISYVRGDKTILPKDAPTSELEEGLYRTVNTVTEFVSSVKKYGSSSKRF